MAATRTGALNMGIVLLTMQLLWPGGSRAQSPDCSTALTTLTPCLPYITDKSSTPEENCCTKLKDVVSSSPLCLCQVVDGSFGVSGINRTRAMELPAACNLQTPPASRCNATSPSASPLTATPSSPEVSGSVPATASSDGSSIKASSSLLLLFFFIIAASYCSSASMIY
ncbi:unnamed protein product [Linum tenue]|uniref:Bifunctional inhibitor/plant lipid transfer protein/seed storage helical domain-containing protein n=1 Tax=Linum tenue TaxID=586396 RepID=A0AAV0P4P1_9ROSI|nr:unnamed protein product [Linum tenue]